LAGTQQLLVTVETVPTIHADVPAWYDSVDSRYGSADQVVMVAAEDIDDLLIETIWVPWFIVFRFHKIIYVETFIVVVVIVLDVVGVVVVQVVHIFFITHDVVGWTAVKVSVSILFVSL
jgi:hypothetical protein